MIDRDVRDESELCEPSFVEWLGADNTSPNFFERHNIQPSTQLASRDVVVVVVVVVVVAVAVAVAVVAAAPEPSSC
jgi:hypothetical protein